MKLGLAGALAGGIWGFLPGLLKAKLGVHEVIVSIMMNYIALYTMNEIIRCVLTDQKQHGDGFYISFTVTSSTESLVKMI